MKVASFSKFFVKKSLPAMGLGRNLFNAAFSTEPMPEPFVTPTGSISRVKKPKLIRASRAIDRHCSDCTGVVRVAIDGRFV